ncbi:MAG: hypothetical protein ABI861_11570 [Panacibacter sp.]
MRILFPITIALMLIALNSCKNTENNKMVLPAKWYNGEAELTSYSLEQARYGQIHSGEAVLIFVTEDFSPTKFVKLDDATNVKEKLPVLKMNFTKKFNTGIYPYSMMLSVFTPAINKGNERAIKANCTSQEWCGQTFSQFVLNGGKYSWQLHSYFEQEGDQSETFNAALLEDDIWSHIRINPATLPQGKIQMLPGLLWQRLSHIKMQPEEANVSLTAADSFFIDQPGLRMYTIQYPVSQRTLSIYFEANETNDIIGWQESYPDGVGSHKKVLMTNARRKKTIWLNYWKHNSIADSSYRDSLGIRF